MCIFCHVTAFTAHPWKRGAQETPIIQLQASLWLTLTFPRTEGMCSQQWHFQWWLFDHRDYHKFSEDLWWARTWEVHSNERKRYLGSEIEGNSNNCRNSTSPRCPMIDCIAQIFNTLYQHWLFNSANDTWHFTYILCKTPFYTKGN